MKTISFFLAIIMGLPGFYASAQHQNKKQNEFFILGTLSDYAGRKLDSRRLNVVDRYYSSEDMIVAAVDSLINDIYPGKVHVGVEKARTVISSDSLAIRLNSFYDFKSGGIYASGAGGEFFMGTLKDDIFQNDQEKLAFLAGAFFRFGSIQDSTYRIVIAASTNKAKICNQLLKEFGCRPKYLIDQTLISFAHVVVFLPSPKVLTYLKQYESLPNRNSRKVSRH